MYNGYRSDLNHELGGELFVPSVSVDDLPATIDWRVTGYVTDVKNQVSYNYSSINQPRLCNYGGQ